MKSFSNSEDTFFRLIEIKDYSEISYLLSQDKEKNLINCLDKVNASKN